MEQTLKASAWPARIQRLRLASGLILFAYVVTHLLNHSVGLISLQAMDAVRPYFLDLWRNLVGTVLLYGAFTIHISLAIWSLFRRRTLRMPAWEAAQLLFGLMIPPLLFIHVLGTRLAFELYGTNDTYAYLQILYFVFEPEYAIQQTVVLLVAWVHACIGLHFWLRIKPWYRRWYGEVYALAILVPTLSLIGFVKSGDEASTLARDESWRQAVLSAVNLPKMSEVDFLYRLESWLLYGFAALVLTTLAARALRTVLRRRHGVVTLSYPGGRKVSVIRGTSILDASRSANIAHASVCGGRGRCSTCRVRLGQGLEDLPAPSEEEAKVLARVGAPPMVRLACQTRPVADLEVTPLLPPTASPRQAGARPSYLQGEEREISVLFADLRGFTTLSEQKLPYDVVFILNRYFSSMGTAVQEAGGRIDKFIGDGVMALFGLETDPATGSRQAMDGARRMSESLAQLNEALSHDLAQPLRIGIGIHSGSAIVGEMGFAPAVSVTAVGDTVNTASRLESMTKDFKVELVVSERVAALADLPLPDAERRDIEVRGRKEKMAVVLVPRASDLAGELAANEAGNQEAAGAPTAPAA